ncbi:hypothetical protein RJG79_01240 [Mycoplasmatota bacterium WC44]
MKIDFEKYSTLGNNFIIANYSANFDEKLINEMCNEKMGIGADGLILAKNNPAEMIYYNKDGSLAKLCGNGLRCVAHYLHKNNWINKEDYILVGGLKYKSIIKDDVITVYLIKTDEVRNYRDDKNNSYFVNMIVPHVVFTNPVSNKEQVALKIREIYAYENANVNFYESGMVTTYENGVGFTSSCGTGAASTAFVLGKNLHQKNIYGEMDVIVDKYISLRSKVKCIFKGVYYA